MINQRREKNERWEAGMNRIGERIKNKTQKMKKIGNPHLGVVAKKANGIV